jgi:uncharacterized repeat protein (TIGR02543 family)
MKKILLAFTFGFFLTMLIACSTTETIESTTEGTTFYMVGFVVYEYEGFYIDSVNVEKGQLLTEPTALSIEGYTFDGWFKEYTFTNPWVFETDTVTSNLTLHAKWTPIQVVPHLDSEISFISGYWASGQTSITTTNADMDFLNGYAASQPQSKTHYENVNSIIIDAGYQLKVIFLSYDGYGNYSVVYCTAPMAGTIFLDETFWGDYDYIAFNISSVPSNDLSDSLDLLPLLVSFVEEE